jgi:hypothetical protein
VANVARVPQVESDILTRNHGENKKKSHLVTPIIITIIIIIIVSYTFYAGY